MLDRPPGLSPAARRTHRCDLLASRENFASRTKSSARPRRRQLASILAGYPASELVAPPRVSTAMLVCASVAISSRHSTGRGATASPPRARSVGSRGSTSVRPTFAGYSRGALLAARCSAPVAGCCWLATRTARHAAAPCRRAPVPSLRADVSLPFVRVVVVVLGLFRLTLGALVLL